MVQLWTPETLYDSHGTPYQNHMARQDDSTEDDILYVKYDDYKAVAKVRDAWCAEYTRARDLLRQIVKASHHEQPGVLQAIEDYLTAHQSRRNAK